MRLPLLSLLALSGLSFAVACNTAELTKSASAPNSTDSATAPDAEEPDEDADDKAAPKAPAKAPADEPALHLSCPAPSVVKLADLPKTGFLPPVKVTVARLADGDSGEFNFPDAPKQGVRSLWINTEEVGGDEMTQFGQDTKVKVLAFYKAAKEVTIAVQESSPGSGKPHLDPYDRWLSLIFLDGELLQARLVKEGLTAYYTLYGCAPSGPIHNALLYGEAEANDNKRGIWAPGPHNDYQEALAEWIGNKTCRPNPYKGPYCAK